MENLAPIVLFCYNRLNTLTQTVEALQKNVLAKDSELFIFSDGAKQRQEEKVQAVQKYIKTISGFKKITIEESPVNKGLANSIIDGVTKIVNQYGKIIVLEDDLITSPYFLTYMNDSLEMYKNDEEVACITGYTYSLSNPKTNFENQTFFLKGADCWSWATWKRGWDLFEKDGQKLLNEIQNKNLKKEFDFNDSYPYFEMLENQIKGLNNSWAIRWYASAFLKNKLCLYPYKSLVQNIGFDENATHCKNKNNKFDVNIDVKTKIFKKIPVCENKKMKKEFEKYLKKITAKKMQLIKKEKDGNKTEITLFGFIKFSYKKSVEQTGFFGDYKTWKDVSKKCKGYNAKNILAKTLNSTLAVKEGRAVFERDSYIFDKIQYSDGLLNSLKEVLKDDGELKVLDFGGALGSHYFQNRTALTIANIKNWTVVEQPHYVKVGNKQIADNILNFKNTIDEVEGANVLILSGVLQYLSEPYVWLEKFINKGVKYIIIDRTAFSLENRDRLTLQIVPKKIYEAKYPAWFLDERKFLSFFEKKYELINDFDDTIDNVPEIPSYFKGYFLKKGTT